MKQNASSSTLEAADSLSSLPSTKKPTWFFVPTRSLPPFFSHPCAGTRVRLPPATHPHRATRPAPAEGVTKGK